MKEISAQIIKGCLVPFSPEDNDQLAEYKPNQILKLKICGFKKQRSVSQLGLMMACIKFVADNSEDENWNAKERAKLSLKARLNYVDDSSCVVMNGKVIVAYRSFSFANLAHMEACNLFERAFVVLADVLGMTVEELIEAAQSLMLKNRV